MNYNLIIIGGGTAGLMVASQFRRKNPNYSIGLIEPSKEHYYQPAFTLVGAGDYDYEATIRKTEDFIPQSVDWIQEKALRIDAQSKTVYLASGVAHYDILVIATGLVNRIERLPGLKEGLEQGIVCSNYVDARQTWEQVKNFKGGTAIFTQPSTPIKCGGAPQKAAYMSSDYWRKKGLLDGSEVIFATPGSVIFGVEIVAKSLLEVVADYGILLKTGYNPIKIDVEHKKIHFKTPNTSNLPIQGEQLSEDEVAIRFDFLHLAPPQSPPDVILESNLINETGWVDVDMNTLQHKTYPNIFALGDVAGLPTAKTGAAIRKQVPVVVENILKVFTQNSNLNKSYNGYSSCPLVTGYGKMILAEFNYKLEFTPDPKLKSQLFVFDSYKPHWRLWLLKKYILPYLYWQKMLKGHNV